MRHTMPVPRAAGPAFPLPRPIPLLLLLLLATLTPTSGWAQAGGAPAGQALASGEGPRLVATVEGITEYALPNGLRVLLFPDPTKSTVTVNITYLVGSRHEGYGESGMAHLLEHLLFKGSTNHPDIGLEFTRYGAQSNGTTWYDRTNYYETVPATDAHVEWALDLEADRMVNSFVSAEDLRSEFSVVRNELESGENNPARVTLQRMMSTAYLWHGYGRATIGARSDLENMPIERLQAFYRRYYQPDNAVLVVAGGFDPAHTLQVIERKFGAIPRPERSLAAGNLLYGTYTAEPPQDGEREVTVRRVGDVPLVYAGFHVPPGSHPDFAAISVLARVLGDSPSGRLYKGLVEAGLAADVYVEAFQLKEPGMLFAQARLHATQSLPEARAAMEAVLAEAAHGPFTEQEVDRARTAMAREVALTLNNSEWVGYDLTEWASLGDWRLLFVHRDRVAAVTAEDVQRVAATYLQPTNRTVAMFVPTAAPALVETPWVADVGAMVAGYKGRDSIQVGEAFEASPRAIESRLTRSTLENGMKLTLLPKQTRGGSVTVQIVLRHGSEESLAGKVFTANLTGGLLARGTTTLSREQVQDSLDKLGANVSVGGGPQSANASIQTTRENVVAALELVVQQLRFPRLDAAELETLRRERLTNAEQQRSQPQNLANRALNRILSPFPPGHVFRAVSVDEQIAALEAVTIDGVQAFHRDFYGASNGDIAVVGDFDPSAFAAAAARLFGDWRSVLPFARVERPYVPVDSLTILIETPGMANANLVMGANLPMRDSDPDYPAMVLMNFMLGGAWNSRLWMRIREREGISYGVGSGFSASAQDPEARLSGYAIYAPENLDRLLIAFDEEIERVRTEGFTDEEVATAKSGWLQENLQRRADDGFLANMLMTRRFDGRTLLYDEELERRIEALTPAEIGAAARRHLNPATMVRVVAGDFRR